MPIDSKRNDAVAKTLDRARCAALLLALGAAALLVPLPWRMPAELTARQVASGRDLDGVLTALTLGGASIAVFLLLSWVLVLGVLTLVAKAPGALGRVARGVLVWVTPGFLRRSIAIGMSVGALTGVATSTAPAVAGTAVAAPAIATMSIDGPAPASGPSVPARRLAGSITQVASAVAEGADRMGDHATTASAARVCLLLSVDGAVDDVSRPGWGTATQGTTTPEIVASGTAASVPAASGTAASVSAAPATAAPGTAARGVPSPMPAGEIDLDWPVHRPSTVSRAPVDLDWPSPATVVVHRGDTLWSIAARELGPEATDAQIDTAWHRWYAANRGVIGNDPDVILPGQQLQAPPARTP